MKKKSGKTTRRSTIHVDDSVGITDPVQLEAIDRRCKVFEAAMALDERIAGIGCLLMNLSPKALLCVIAALDDYQKRLDELGRKDGLPADDAPDVANERQSLEAIKRELQECREAVLRTPGSAQTVPEFAVCRLR